TFSNRTPQGSLRPSVFVGCCSSVVTGRSLTVIVFELAMVIILCTRHRFVSESVYAMDSRADSWIPKKCRDGLKAGKTASQGLLPVALAGASLIDKTTIKNSRP